MEMQPITGQMPVSEVKEVLPKKQTFEFRETLELVALVNEATELVGVKGEKAFDEFRVPGTRWRQDEKYIFVLSLDGEMLVHPELEGQFQMDLKDVDGKLIIRGLIEAATSYPDKPFGWYHYQWPVPGGLVPRWKSSYVRLIKTPSGKNYIIGSGVYNDRMEKEFVVDLVNSAVKEIEKKGKEAYKLFHDPAGPFLVKDAYIFVIELDGVERVNPAFPSIEGRNMLNHKDPQGKYINREILQLVQGQGYGWIEYMWPKPGESVATRKSTYVKRAIVDNKLVAVGCGVYLSNAPKESIPVAKLSAKEVMNLVREAGLVLEEKGERAFAEFRKKGSKWFSDHVYLFVFAPDGTRVFHAAEPESEGRNDAGIIDVVGRPIFRMIYDAANSPTGEGWIHYMYPLPGEIFPTWKSTFVKKVRFPGDKEYFLGCGVYNMQMDKLFIEDLVKRAAVLLQKKGTEAFPILRDKKGPFVFMDTYVFVETVNGIELVNPVHPTLEGRNLMEYKDLKGKPLVKEEIDAALSEGSTWIDSYWFKPGDNTPAFKPTFVQKVEFEGDSYIVGSGFYPDESPVKTTAKKEVNKISWDTMPEEKLSETMSRKVVFGEKFTLAKFQAKKGHGAARHFHSNEEFLVVLSGMLKYMFDDKEVIVNAGESLLIPPDVPHSIEVLQPGEFFVYFAPVREDWVRGEDNYFRN